MMNSRTKSEIFFIIESVSSNNEYFSIQRDARLLEEQNELQQIIKQLQTWL